MNLFMKHGIEVTERWPQGKDPKPHGYSYITFCLT